MQNRIESWSWELPTEDGDYLACFGDVETPDNVHFLRVVQNHLGELVDKDDRKPISGYSRSFKFARLEYRPSELNK